MYVHTYTKTIEPDSQSISIDCKRLFSPLSSSFPFYVFQKPTFIPYRSDLCSRVVGKSLTSPSVSGLFPFRFFQEKLRIVPISIRLTTAKSWKRDTLHTRHQSPSKCSSQTPPKKLKASLSETFQYASTPARPLRILKLSVCIMS